MKINKMENAIIVILSFPDTIVRPAYREYSSRIWPKIGIGNKHAIQAGHSALLLIKKNESDSSSYMVLGSSVGRLGTTGLQAQALHEFKVEQVFCS